MKHLHLRNTSPLREMFHEGQLRAWPLFRVYHDQPTETPWWWSPSIASGGSGKTGPYQNRFQLYLAATVANLTLVDAKAGFTGKTGSGPQHWQCSGRRHGQPRRRVARANLDTHFARVGITVQIILPNKGFPSEFLARIGYTESTPDQARTHDGPAAKGELQLSYRTIFLGAEYWLRPWLF